MKSILLSSPPPSSLSPTLLCLFSLSSSLCPSGKVSSIPGWPWIFYAANRWLWISDPPSLHLPECSDQRCTNVTDVRSAGDRIPGVVHARQIFHQLSCMLSQSQVATELNIHTSAFYSTHEIWPGWGTFRAILFRQTFTNVSSDTEFCSLCNFS